MKFLSENWFFILVLIGFFLMMSGHGGCGMHGGHGGHTHKTDDKTDNKTEAHDEEEVHAQHH
jgi:hypothetical protein